jgi:hypothetical protein
VEFDPNGTGPRLLPWSDAKRRSVPTSWVPVRVLHLNLDDISLWDSGYSSWIFRQSAASLLMSPRSYVRLEALNVQRRGLIGRSQQTKRAWRRRRIPSGKDLTAKAWSHSRKIAEARLRTEGPYGYRVCNLQSDDVMMYLRVRQTRRAKRGSTGRNITGTVASAPGARP